MPPTSSWPIDDFGQTHTGLLSTIPSKAVPYYPDLREDYEDKGRIW